MKCGVARFWALAVGAVGFAGWLCVLVCVLLPGSVYAHDIKEMTISARLHADRIDVVITTSPHLASAILADADSEKGRPEKVEVFLNADTFAELRPKFEAQGKRLCSLWTGAEPAQELDLVRIDVVARDDGEVSFYVTYPPAAEGGLRFDAVVLERLDPGYVVVLEVLDAKRKRLGLKALVRGDSSLTLPHAGDAAAVAPK